MFSATVDYDLPCPASEVFAALQLFERSRDTSLTGTAQRFFLSSNIAGHYRWERVTENEAFGVLVKPTKNMTGMKLSVRATGPRRLTLGYSTPNFAIVLFCLFLPFVLFIPPMWLLLIAMVIFFPMRLRAELRNIGKSLGELAANSSSQAR